MDKESYNEEKYDEINQYMKSLGVKSVITLKVVLVDSSTEEPGIKLLSLLNDGLLFSNKKLFNQCQQTLLIH